LVFSILFLIKINTWKNSKKTWVVFTILFVFFFSSSSGVLSLAIYRQWGTSKSPPIYFEEKINHLLSVHLLLWQNFLFYFIFIFYYV
jgi:hypothetical protein